MDDYLSKRAESYIEALTQSFYSSEDVERVCRAGRVPFEHAAEILDELEHAARRWHENSTAENENLDRVKRELSRLAKAAEEFSEALGEATAETWHAMFHASHQTHFAYQVSLQVDSPDEFSPGPISIRIDDPGDWRTVAHSRSEVISWVMERRRAHTSQ